MRLSEIWKLVWLNLAQNKSKVILTSVGIVVGAATIMLVIAIGTGGKEEIAEQFKNLNAGAIDISYEMAGGFGQMGDGMGGFPGGGSRGGFPGGGSGGGMPSGGMPSMGGFPGGDMMGGFFGMFGGGSDRMNRTRITLSEEDSDELLTFVPGIMDATLSYSTTADVEGGELDEASTYTVAGVKDNYGTISNLETAIGEFFSEESDETKEKVCVLGAEVAKAVFGSAYDAFGETIYIDSRPYVVNGVLNSMGTVTSGISPDGTIFIPYQTGIKYLTGNSVSPTITVIAKEVSMVEQIMSDITTVMAEKYPNAEFTIEDAGSKMEAAEKSNQTLQLLLIAMAAIVFCVGGIGIMNVLFVSVKERTNEIGILKALGCSRKDIMLEFLLEASCISFIGAVIGVLLSLAITPIIESFSVRVSLSVGGAILSLLFGILTGTIFGFYPAYKASRLIPVVALNHE